MTYENTYATALAARNEPLTQDECNAIGFALLKAIVKKHEQAAKALKKLGHKGNAFDLTASILALQQLYDRITTTPDIAQFSHSDLSQMQDVLYDIGSPSKAYAAIEPHPDHAIFARVKIEAILWEK